MGPATIYSWLGGRDPTPYYKPTVLLIESNLSSGVPQEYNNMENSHQPWKKLREIQYVANVEKESICCWENISTVYGTDVMYTG